MSNTTGKDGAGRFIGFVVAIAAVIAGVIILKERMKQLEAPGDHLADAA